MPYLLRRLALLVPTLLGFHTRLGHGTGPRDLLQLPSKELSRVRGLEIAMVFQEPMTSLNPVFTIGMQLAEPLRAHERVGWREALDRAAAMLDRVGITDPRRRLREYPHQLSGGMRQRVMIAMALILIDPDKQARLRAARQDAGIQLPVGPRVVRPWSQAKKKR